MMIQQAAKQETPNPRLRQLDHRYEGLSKVTGKAKYARRV